jgi:integrase
MKKGKGKYGTEHVEWVALKALTERLGDENEYFWKNTITIGVFLALRVSDLLNLRWADVIDEQGNIRSHISVIEGKTKKSKTEPRIITLSEDGISAIRDMRERYNLHGSRSYLISPHTEKASDQWLNKHLKRIFEKYEVPYGANVSSHLFRKTFGYRYAQINDFSYESILYLNKIFRHSSLETTLIYLGLESKAIEDAYHSVCKL